MNTDGGNVAKSTSRRTIVKGAAWSIPVVAAAVAAPLAAASVNNASLSFTNSTTSLLSLKLLDGTGVLTAQALVTVPTELTLQNGPGDLSGTAVVTVLVGRPSGINISLGRVRGFGVAAFNGVDSTSAQRTAVYRKTPFTQLEYGFPTTSFTTTTTLSVASNGALVLPIVFGLAGKNDAVAVGLLTSFPVTVNIVLGGKTFTASSTISVPVGAGLL